MPLPWTIDDATVEVVTKNLDRPRSVRSDSDAIHVCVTFSRPKQDSDNWERKRFYFTLPAGSDLPTPEEAQDAIIADATEWEDLKWADQAELASWATSHGYTPDSAIADMALKFIDKRSRRLRGLDSKGHYHSLLWEDARLQDNRWGTRLTVSGQMPATLPSGLSQAHWGEGALATIEQVPTNRDRPKSVRRDAPGIHICLTLGRDKSFKRPDGAFSLDCQRFFFTIPAGVGLPTPEEALDAVIADALDWYSWRTIAPSVHWRDPGLSWATKHGYTLGGEDAAAALQFVAGRSRRMEALGYDTVSDLARLPNNRWLSSLTVTGQVPATSSPGSRDEAG
jgi:hypothetical protein